MNEISPINSANSHMAPQNDPHVISSLADDIFNDEALFSFLTAAPPKPPEPLADEITHGELNALMKAGVDINV